MRKLSRRTVLGGAAGALTLGTAGWLSAVQPSQDSATSDEDTVPDGLEATFEFVFQPSEGGTFRISKFVDGKSMGRGIHHSELAELGDPEWAVWSDPGSDSTEGGLVVRGDFEVDADDERYAADGSRGDFDRYRVDQEHGDEAMILATDGETLLRGDQEWVTSTLDRHDADAEPYLDSTDGARALLAVVDYTGQVTLVDDSEEIRKPFERAELDTDTLPDRLVVQFARTDEEMRYTLAGWYAELPEDATDPLTGLLSTQLSMDDISTDVRADENVAIARASRPYTPPEERPETVRFPRFEGYDADAGVVRFVFEDGDELPTDRYELEIEDEPYDGDWARGQEEIGEGSVIAIDADAIEPGDQLTISYEAPDDGYSGSTGTTVLRDLPFAVDFDPNERTATLRYVEGPPLDAGRITATVHGPDEAGDDEEDERQVFSGELTIEDTTTLSDLPIEGYVTVEYERSDGEAVRIGGASFGPPGRFDFEYDGRAERMTITYPDPRAGGGHPGHPGDRHRLDQEPLDAEHFDITVDGEPVDRQWADAGDEIEPGASITISDVPVDSEVAVAWVGADGQRHRVAETHTVPDVEIEFGYDAEDESVTITHAGGQSVDAEKLRIRLHADEERTVEWNHDGEVSEGDEITVDDVPEHGYLVVTYRDHHIDHTAVHRLREEG